ncbi:hypothetical protein [Haloplanus pelagicus]|jgi:hypothetical protein|uniref:hypothetical protein n=1 Tax=Haloplanus pelagicus TaxID=2949995 RepID=UPI00204234FF|nr:hypothetical protein [Haloplanus sp. HW8-1]
MTGNGPSGNQPDDGDCVVCGDPADGVDAPTRQPICRRCASIRCDGGQEIRPGRRRVTSSITFGGSSGNHVATPGDDVNHISGEVDIEVSGASSDYPHPTRLQREIEAAVADMLDDYAERVSDDVDRGDGIETDGGEDQFSVRVGEMVREIEEDVEDSTKAEAMLYARCSAAFEDLLDHYRQFAYASREHVILELLFHVGCRVGALHGLDVADYHPDEAYLEFVNREPETPLKNDVHGERPVALSDRVVDVIEDYRRVNRPDVSDDQGRRPLIATTRGRMSISAMRDTVYRMTRPCEYGECPHDRDPENCEAMKTGRASRCPSSRAPHDVRAAAIMRMRGLDIPAEVVSARVNATQEVIEDYYDERTPRERMEQRREKLGDLD